MEKAVFTFEGRILRREDVLPRYIVVKPEHAPGGARGSPPRSR